MYLPWLLIIFMLFHNMCVFKGFVAFWRVVSLSVVCRGQHLVTGIKPKVPTCKVCSPLSIFLSHLLSWCGGFVWLDGFVLGTTPSGALDLLLVLYSGLTPSISQLPYIVPEILIWVDHAQGKHLSPCTLSSTSYAFLFVYWSESYPL